MRRFAALLLVLASVLLAAGCGGSSPSAEEPPEPSPPSAGTPAPDGGLTVEEALASELDSVLLVTGALVVVEGETPRLCSALAESFPPQCGGASLLVEGLELASIENLQHEGSVSWVENVQLLGTVTEGVLTVSELSI